MSLLVSRFGDDRGDPAGAQQTPGPDRSAAHQTSVHTDVTRSLPPRATRSRVQGAAHPASATARDLPVDIGPRHLPREGTQPSPTSCGSLSGTWSRPDERRRRSLVRSPTRASGHLHGRPADVGRAARPDLYGALTSTLLSAVGLHPRTAPHQRLRRPRGCLLDAPSTRGQAPVSRGTSSLLEQRCRPTRQPTVGEGALPDLWRDLSRASAPEDRATPPSAGRADARPPETVSHQASDRCPLPSARRPDGQPRQECARGGQLARTCTALLPLPRARSLHPTDLCVSDVGAQCRGEDPGRQHSDALREGGEARPTHARAPIAQPSTDRSRRGPA